MGDDPLQRVPLAHVLHPEALRGLAGARAFARGRQYFAEGRISEMARRDGSLTALVRGGEPAPYRVRIWVRESRLAYACSCPAGAEGDCCKHTVALALAWLDTSGRTHDGRAHGSGPPLAPEAERIRLYLERIAPADLRVALLAAVARDPQLRADLLRLADLPPQPE